jgi:adenosylcobinamide-phosphate synthase
VEAFAYGPPGLAAGARRIRGVLAVAGLLSPALLIALAVENTPAGPAAAVAGLCLALGGRSLREHAEAVHEALRAKNLEGARLAVGRIVSRDTREMDEGRIAAAAVESVLENGCDAVFGALFWFYVGGLPGVAVYRLANTLDAIWGYRSERYHAFGWAAARLDDVLNFLPARLTALSYALCGNLPTALRAWRRQGRYWKSPNAGPVMAAGAGALGIVLGGPAVYHGQLVQRPALGYGRPAEAGDIARAVALVRHSLALWLAAMFAGGFGLA